MTAPIRQRSPACRARIKRGVPKLSIDDRDDVTAVSLRGELDLLGASGPRAQLSDMRCQRQPRFVADLTGMAFIDCACRSVHARQRSANVLATPAGPRSCGVPLIHKARSRVILEVSVPHGPAIRAGRGPCHAGGAIPEQGWLS